MKSPVAPKGRKVDAMGWQNVTAHGGLKPPLNPSKEAIGTALMPGKGRVVPLADVTLNAGIGTYEPEIAIPDGVVAVRVHSDALFHATPDITEADPAETGPTLPYDCVFDVSCLGCTWLHLAQGAGVAIVQIAWVHNGQGV